MILQPGTGPLRSSTYLAAEPDALLWGRLPCASDDPVLTVDAGTEVTVDTISHEGVLEDQGRDPRAFFAAHGVKDDEVLSDAVALAASDVAHTFGVDGPLAPFLGIMGVATAEPERPHSVPPGAYGGNIDINLLTVGSTLYLPVQVAGALAYVGDPHFAQGDGEVSLTALEASLRATVRLDVVAREEAVARFGELAGPLAETADHLVPTGMDADLDVAVQNCVRAAIALLGARYGMAQHLAYAYLSAATDFDISQVVDLVKGVHARIRTSDFAALR